MVADLFRCRSRLSLDPPCQCWTMTVGVTSANREALMLRLSKRASPNAALIAVATLLSGCVTGTEVSYSEYQYDRYGGTERTYERKLYADPSPGIEVERCRTVA